MRRKKLTCSVMYILFIFLFGRCADEVEIVRKEEYKETIVTVEPGIIVRQLDGNEVGINMNYLMDDGSLPCVDYKATVNNLREIGAKFLRYPGGEKSDNYLFSSYPYVESAPRTVYCNWPNSDSSYFNTDGTAKSSVLDFDEFIKMCDELKATPFIVVPYDAAYSRSSCGKKPDLNFLINHAKEWVRYANIKNNYNVKYWMIGNESYHNSEYNGTVSAAQYALDIQKFATAMREVDPEIKIIANGMGKAWWNTLLASKAVESIDYFSLSNYADVVSYQSFQNEEQNLLEYADEALEAIELNAPASVKERLGVIISEYNSIDWTKSWKPINNLGHALCNFQMFGDALLRPKIFASCLWNTRWVSSSPDVSLYNAIGQNGDINPTGTVLKIFSENLLSSMVQTSSSSNAIKAYSSIDENLKQLNILILNKDIETHEIVLNISNSFGAPNIKVISYAGESEDDINPSFTILQHLKNEADEIIVEAKKSSVTIVKIRTSD